MAQPSQINKPFVGFSVRYTARLAGQILFLEREAGAGQRVIERSERLGAEAVQGQEFLTPVMHKVGQAGDADGAECALRRFSNTRRKVKWSLRDGHNPERHLEDSKSVCVRRPRMRPQSSASKRCKHAVKDADAHRIRKGYVLPCQALLRLLVSFGALDGSVMGKNWPRTLRRGQSIRRRLDVILASVSREKGKRRASFFSRLLRRLNRNRRQPKRLRPRIERHEIRAPHLRERIGLHLQLP